MPRVRVIHWKPAEAAPLIEALQSMGHHVEFDEGPDAAAIGRAIKANPPDIVAIDTTRLPAHGREFARYLGETKKSRLIPVLFVPDDLRGKKLKKAIEQTIREWVPPARVEHVSTKTVAEKLGLKDGEEAGVVNEPGDCKALSGFAYALLKDQPVTLWFLESEEELASGLRRMCAIAPKTKLWLAWRKGQKSRLNGNTIRETLLGAGLVDYKICSLDERWSAMAFARRKAP